MTAKVAIVGRPNVGKSTLFNRLVGKRLAIVDDPPGVTRDRREGAAMLGDLEFTAVDTAGLEDSDVESMTGRMRLQTEAAVFEADAVLFVIDGRAGVTPLDSHFANWLRKQKTPVILVANKCEGGAGKSGVGEAYALGLGDLVDQLLAVLFAQLDDLGDVLDGRNQDEPGILAVVHQLDQAKLHATDGESVAAQLVVQGEHRLRFAFFFVRRDGRPALIPMSRGFVHDFQYVARSARETARRASRKRWTSVGLLQ